MMRNLYMSFVMFVCRDFGKYWSLGVIL